MQRLGYLKYLVWRASLSETNIISNLGKDLIAAVTEKVSVRLTPDIQIYSLNALTDTAHKDLKSIALKSTEHDSNGKIVRLEIQDYYLASDELPSRRGKLVYDDGNRYPYLAIDLNLIRKGTGSLLTRGKSFLNFVSDEERRSFIVSNISLRENTANPFLFTLPQKLLLMFSFIEGDGDILKMLYAKVLCLSGDFSAQDAGNYLPEIYRHISKEISKRIRTGEDFIKVRKILDTADKIEAVKQKASPGGKNAREHSITLRLEAFVDFGLLSKPDPFSYRYEVTNEARYFFETFTSDMEIDYFLKNSFFNSINKAFGLFCEHQADRASVLYAIQKAYSILKNPLGYAPIHEVNILAAILSIVENRKCFEISESIDVLKSLQKERPDDVRFNVDYWGSLTFVKLNKEII